MQNRYSRKLRLWGWKAGFHIRRAQMPLMLRMLDIKEGDLALDVGCGYGYLSSEICKRKAATVAVDIRRVYLKETSAVTRDCQCYCVLATATHLPFRPSSFNKVLMSSVLQHVPEYKKALEEAKRVVNTGGILAINVPNEKPHLYLPQIFRQSYLKVRKELSRYYTMYHNFTVKMLKLELENTGLVVTDLEYSPKFVVAFLYEMIVIFHIILQIPLIAYFLSVFYFFCSKLDHLLPKNSMGTEFTVRAIKRCR